MSVTKRYSNVPTNTLSIVEDNKNTIVSSYTGKQLKTEKIVRFASESESFTDGASVQSSASSGGIITWVPSEHLYDDDTFISESHKEYSTVDCGTVSQIDPSYGTNTFIDFDSEDETKTLSEYSYTDSFASSGIFSTHSHSDRPSSREWRDITEIVKDIEELAVSEFITTPEPQKLWTDHDRASDYIESEDEEMVEESKQNFLHDTIRRLKLKDVQSPRSLDQLPVIDISTDKPFPVLGDEEKAVFYQKMIQFCIKTKASPAPVPHQNQEQKSHQLEFYGLSSGIVEKLKTHNFQHWLQKRLADIDKETQDSLQYIEHNKHMMDEFHKQQFINDMKACVLRENIDDCIQVHLIHMDPIMWFSDLINELDKTKNDKDSREIIYRYKRHLENMKNA